MILALLAFLGGALTIVSPCILPVLPFVFARGGRSFFSSTLPLLIGMAVTFAAVATLAAVGGAWAVRVNAWGRWVALLLLTLFGLALLSRRLADYVTRPLVAFGSRVVQSGTEEGSGSVVQSLLLGFATGFLWAPCAGPILGLILTGAALSGPNPRTTLLLLAYAVGAATSLAIVLLAGGHVVRALKRSLGVGDWVRRGLGVLVLVAVMAIALGWDTGILTRLSLNGTNTLEQRLLQSIQPPSTGSAPVARAKVGELPVEGELPALEGAVAWLNSMPLSAEGLRGKVVLVDFWTYSCINCLRELPYVKAWARKYGPAGLVVIGVHTPEFAFERVVDNVAKATRDLELTYPIAIDSDHKIWAAFHNVYWPALYFVDAQGRIRHHHFGEGRYDESERIIRQLLAQTGAHNVPIDTATVSGQGAQAAASGGYPLSPETYVGYARTEHFASPEGVRRDVVARYSAPETLAADQWALSGSWRVGPEAATLQKPHGIISFRFSGRDLHLVLGPGNASKPLRFRVRLDGADPEDNHGADIGADGAGVVSEERLYQLIRLAHPGEPHTVKVEFLEAGVEAFAFTFG